jgi:hypothetical protein
MRRSPLGYQLGQVGTDWQFASLGGFNGSDTTEMLLRNSKTSGFEIYDICNNNISRAALQLAAARAATGQATAAEQRDELAGARP